jgi:hypothetical protein
VPTAGGLGPSRLFLPVTGGRAGWPGVPRAPGCPLLVAGTGSCWSGRLRERVDTLPGGGDCRSPWPGGLDFPAPVPQRPGADPWWRGYWAGRRFAGCRLRSKVLGLHLLESASIRRNANHLSKAIAAHLHDHYRLAHPQSLQGEGAPAMTSAPIRDPIARPRTCWPESTGSPRHPASRHITSRPLPRRGPGAALPAEQPVRPGDRQGAAISVNTVTTPVPETRRAQPHPGRRAGSRPRPTHTICLSNEHRKPAI